MLLGLGMGGQLCLGIVGARTRTERPARVATHLVLGHRHDLEPVRTVAPRIVTFGRAPEDSVGAERTAFPGAVPLLREIRSGINLGSPRRSHFSRHLPAPPRARSSHRGPVPASTAGAVPGLKCRQRQATARDSHEAVKRGSTEIRKACSASEGAFSSWIIPRCDEGTMPTKVWRRVAARDHRRSARPRSFGRQELPFRPSLRRRLKGRYSRWAVGSQEGSTRGGSTDARIPIVRGQGAHRPCELCASRHPNAGRLSAERARLGGPRG